MTLAETIRKRIDKIPKGKTFGYVDLRIEPKDFQASAKALERMHRKQ